MANNNGLAVGKGAPDPHEWSEVAVDVTLRGTNVVLRPLGNGWLCRKCRTFVMLKTDKWNPYYPDMFPCEPKAHAMPQIQKAIARAARCLNR